MPLSKIIFVVHYQRTSRYPVRASCLRRVIWIGTPRVECRQPVDSRRSRSGGPGKGFKREVGGLVGERETATTEAIMATVACRLGSTVSSRLVDTSWGCAFGVGGPREMS
jgi:hypothetical protein